MLNEMFSYRHEIHDYTTRGANQFHMEQFPTNIGLKGMRFYGAKLWNNIFSNFTDVNFIYSFKERLKICYWITTYWEKMTFCISRNVSRKQDMKILLFGGITKI